MEIFKPHAGSWVYPEENFFRIGGVPLFSGFMYAAVGCYMARINRILDIRLNHYPPLWTTLVLAAAIYINFFSHHFMWDIRWALFALTFALFWRTSMHYRVFRFRHKNAAAARLSADFTLHLDCRKHRHMVKDMALPLPAQRLGAGFIRQAWLVVSADDHFGRLGNSGASFPALPVRTGHPALRQKRR